jgi:hypothetical protein
MTDPAATLTTHARGLIAADGGWTQGAYARVLSGTGCDPLAPFARCWCAAGALMAAARTLDLDPGALLEARHRLHAQLDRRAADLESFNDHPRTSRADVLALFDRALAAPVPSTAEAAA